MVAAERLRADGPNAIEERDQRSILSILLGQFASPLVLLLVAASIISLAVGDRVDATIILIIVVVSAGLGFVQEARSAAAVQALRARLALRANVMRDGQDVEVPIAQLVTGDLVELAAGDVVPADGRLVASNHLYVDESAMTGESAPAAKTADAPAAGDPSAGDAAGDPSTADAARDHLVFAGTSVVSGTGRAVVVATGARTAYGLIARRLLERPPRNDFERGVRRFGLLIARIILLLVMGVFAADVALAAPAARLVPLRPGAGRGPDPRAAAGDRDRQPQPRSARPGGPRRPGPPAAGHPEPGQHDRAVYRQDGHPDRGSPDTGAVAWRGR